MLSLEKPLTINGLTVFRDHADPNQFWYLPGPVSLARRSDNEDLAEFSFLKYKPAIVDVAKKGGGFVMFKTTLKLTRQLESRIIGRLNAEPGVTPPVRLAAAPFEEGSVQCIALNLQGAGGTTATPAPEGAFNAVEKILGASIPSMDSENGAAFSLSLSQEGATILEQAMSEGMAPIGVIYSMKYLAMRPAINVEITADFERIFNHFSVSLEAQYMFLRGGIEAAFESLVQTGAIVIKVLTFTDEADEREQEKWALDFFKEDLLSKWFEPTLTPGQTAADVAAADPLSEVIATGRDLLLDATRGNNNRTDGGGTTTTPATNPPAGPGTEQVQPAALTVEQQQPTPLPSGLSVTHVPATSGLAETVTITGAGATVRVDGQPVTPDSAGQVTLTVNPAAQKTIEVEWPAQTEERTFGLFFDFDKPAAAGWRVQPPSTEYRAYVENTTTDPRFRDASGTLRMEGDGNWTGPEHGAERLRAWIQSLPTPRNVRIDAYASHEHVSGANESNRSAHNLPLSTRRRDVALAIVQRAGGTVIGGIAQGDAPASSRPGSHSEMGGDPDNRVAHIIGQHAGTTPSRWRGVLRRPASVVIPPQPQPQPQPQSQPQPQPQQRPAAPSVGGSPIVASLKLKFVRQEERKKITLLYNRAEATRRTYAPQGFFGLMLGDLRNKAKYFKEIDLDDPFFREFKVEASIPIAFEPISLLSAQVALDYGDPAKPRDHKHADFVFVPGDTAPKTFKVFMNSTRDIDYDAGYQYHFDPQSAWAADRSSYEIAADSTVDRTLFVNPYEHIEFREITATPGDIDWEVVDTIEVRLQARGYTQPEPRAALLLTRDSGQQTWRLRGARPAPANRGVTYQLVQRLNDGTGERTDPAEVDIPQIMVHDLFQDALNLEFIPLFDPANVTRVFIDIEYRDQANAYERSERLEIAGTATEPVKLRIALRDRQQRSFRCRFTFVGPSGSFDRRPWVDTEEELQPVQ